VRVRAVSGGLPATQGAVPGMEIRVQARGQLSVAAREATLLLPIGSTFPLKRQKCVASLGRHMITTSRRPAEILILNLSAMSECEATDEGYSGCTRCGRCKHSAQHSKQSAKLSMVRDLQRRSGRRWYKLRPHNI